MGIGEKIKKYRKEKGITQKELAEKIGVSVQAISKWECGSTPDITQIMPLSCALGVSPNELLDYTDGYKQENEQWHDVMRKFGSGSDEIIEFERAVLKKYPSDKTFSFRLATDLEIHGELSDDELERIQYLEMAKGQYLENLKKYPDFDVNREGLINVYMKLGMREEALKCAFESKNKDNLLKIIYTGEELLRHRQMLIEKSFNKLVCESFAYNDIAVWKIVKNMIYAAIPDGNYQRYGRYLNMLDIRIAGYYEKNGDFDAAVESYRDAVRRCKMENSEVKKFTTPLFDRLCADREYYETDGERKILMIEKNESTAKWLHRVMTKEYWDEAQKTELDDREDYKALIDELKEMIS